MNKIELGLAIRERIKSSGISISEVARRTKQSKTTVHSILEGRRYEIDSLYTIMDVIGMSIHIK